MRTEKEIKARLKADKKTLVKISKSFEKYDNVDDMHAIEEYETIIKTLQWALGEEVEG